jgi:hypothetical protein
MSNTQTDEEQKVARIERQQLQIRKEVQAVLNSGDVVSKAQKISPKVEQLDKDFSELSEIIRKAHKRVRPCGGDILLPVVLAGAADKFDEVKGKAIDALEFCIRMCHSLQEALDK